MPALPAKNQAKKRLGIEPSHAHQATGEHGWEGKMSPVIILSP